MRGIHKVHGQNLFPRVEISNTQVHSVKMREKYLKEMCSASFYETHKVVGTWSTGGSGNRYDGGV